MSRLDWLCFCIGVGVIGLSLSLLFIDWLFDVTRRWMQRRFERTCQEIVAGLEDGSLKPDPPLEFDEEGETP